MNIEDHNYQENLVGKKKIISLHVSIYQKLLLVRIPVVAAVSEPESYLIVQ